MNGSMLDVQKDVERYLAREAEQMLARVLGPDRAIVRVSAEMNTKLMREKKELIDLDGKALKKEKIQVKKMTSTGNAKPGAVGAPNPGKAGPVGNESESKTNQEDSENLYDYPSGIVEITNKRQTIERLTVAAFVDLSGPDGKDVQITLADIQETIKKAVGFKKERDEIQVTQVKLPVPNTDTFDEAYATQQSWQNILAIVRNVSIAMVALCAVVIALVVVRRLLFSGSARAADAAPTKLQRVADELDRNPEVLAEILSRWIERAETAERKAA
jgi:flagellar M-ring protein FliF